MKTDVEFIAVRKGEGIINVVIPIEHNFEIEPPIIYNGIKFPETSIEYQLMNYLDEIDKSQLMLEYDLDMIIDYHIYYEHKEEDEIKELFYFLQPVVDMNENLRIPLESIIFESKEILFNCGKTTEQKAKEVLQILGISYKSMTGIMNTLLEKLDNKKRIY
jgi:hypothetical protein